MLNEISTLENTALPEVISRLQHVEEQVSQINRKLQSEPGLPGFEFFIEANGEEIWSGQDLEIHYPRIMEQYSDKRLVINWRSFPVTLI
uniref:Uncharacterized protein n=1 Tax=Candidatus Kentrum sp. DK TaxID=2126562 RepID=A0A450T530_9GAMM|nr:MAG: hypothetical protein BECKDK2373B_GA0170837_11047 [Candidatus Kentron sp. DK]